MKQIYSLLFFILLTQLLVAQDCDDISGNVTPANSTICGGASVLLTATGGSSYEWRLNDVVINGETGNTLNATQAGTYSVIILEGECAVPASNTATVNVTPLPSGSISPANASICPGGEVELTATGGDSYTWFRDGVEIDDEDDPTIHVDEPGTYTVTIHQDECSAPATNSAVVTLSAGPTGTISPANAPICGNGEVTLTATGGTSYTWFRDGDEINGQNDATIEVDDPGTYTVTIHQGDCSGPASNSAVVTAASAPTGSISPANTSVCQGNSVTLTATGGESYTWFRNGVQINGEDDATLNVTQAGTYTATIHQGNCSGPASNNAVVTITANPTGSITPASAAICEGGSVTLTATGGTSYIWFRNGTQINGETDATLNVTQAGTYTATIQQGTCSGAASNSSVVTAGAGPTGTITPAVASICPGGSQTLTATGGESYTWFLNGAEIQGETGATINANQAGIYSVTIHQGDCSGPASNTSVITVTPIPVGTVTPATGTICTGGSLTLTATGGTSYTWFRNGEEIEGQTDATFDATEPGTYFVIIRQGTCSGPALNTAVITASPAPTGAITPATGAICAGGSIELTATGGTSYAWFRNGVAIAGEDDATLTVTQAGTYTATIKQGSCSGPATNNSVITVGNAPSGTIAPATASLCEGGTVQLTATGGTSYTWMRDGVVLAGQTGATINVTEAGTYTATIKQGDCSGPAANSSVVTVGAAPTGTITPASVALCGGAPQVLTATGGESYTWMRDGEVIAGQETATLNVTQAGTYSVIIRNGTCTGPAENTVTVTASEAGVRYPDVGTRGGTGVQLAAREIGVSYEWTPPADLSDATSRTPTTTTRTEREYVVKITTAAGCVVFDTVLVKVSSFIFVPTGFTPNRNGVNEVLRATGEIKTMDFKVFNRWGQMVYQTTQIGAGWDGKYKGVDQPSDTYTWLLSGVGNDGQPFKLTGKTLLIR